MRLSPDVRLDATAPESVPPRAPRPCPACGAPGGTVWGVVEAQLLLRCTTCYTVRTASLSTSMPAMPPLPWGGPGAADTVLPGAFRGPAGGPLDLAAAKDASAPWGELEAVVDSFGCYRQTRRILDVGFGAGQVAPLAQKAGWHAERVALYENPTERLAQVNLGPLADVGRVTAAGYPAGSFDVVAAGDVLAHLPDPQRVLVEIAHVLRPGGLLWARTPHIDGLSGRLLRSRWSAAFPDELQVFSADGARVLFQRAGFRRVRLHFHGAGPEVFDKRHQGGQGLTGQLVHYLGAALARLSAWIGSGRDVPPLPLPLHLDDRLLDVTRLGDWLTLRAET